MACGLKPSLRSVFSVCLLIAGLLGAADPEPFSAFSVTSTSSGVLARLEFGSDLDRLYSVYQTPCLVSNVWNAVSTNLPGTGSFLTCYDLVPHSESTRFYRATSTNIPLTNILLNGDFEIGTPTSGGTSTFDAPPWKRVTLYSVNSWLTDGFFDSAIEIDNQAIEMSWSGTSVYQDFTVLPDRSYLFRVDVLNPTDANNQWVPQLQAEWYDAAMNQIGSALVLDQADNAADPYDTWFELSGSAVAPVHAATGRIRLICITSGRDNDRYYFDHAFVALEQPLESAVVSTEWPYSGNGLPAHTAAAQYAGNYAVAGDDIEMTAIDESPTGSIAASELETLLPGAEINGMAFTSSGRQLFISASGTSTDSILAYNAGTGQLRSFATGLGLAPSSEKLGIAHFKGELFVGTSSGEIQRYQADLNDATGTYLSSISVGEPVRSMAVDIQDEMLYVASPNTLYRLNPSNSVLTQIAGISNILDITFGRTYGATGQGGLIILQDTGSERQISLVSTARLQSGGAISPNLYYQTSDPVSDIAATACGRILGAGTASQMLSDTTDARMGFMEWVADEFDQNILMAKSLCWQDGGLTGMVQNSAIRVGESRTAISSPDAAYWVVCQLLMSDEVLGDLEAQPMVREIIKRHATLEVNTDGQWYHWYDATDGSLSWGGPDYQTSIFSTMKACHMAIRAKEYYPDDPEIVDAANVILGKLRNQRDYIRGLGFQKSPADNLGPTPATGGIFKPYIETHLFSELMAATEPMCENGYLDYWRYRDNHTVDYTLPDEPIIKTKMAGFWRMYDQATIQFCRDDAGWRQEFDNFYALFAGWTDDNAPEHLTAFSAGQTPSGYSSDKYTSHPGTVNSFGTVIGFGLHGNTVPVVGAYFAYRDGRRQAMQGSASYRGAELLTRISYEDSSWLMNAISPTDHQYAGYALGEILSPGSVDRAIAVNTYLESQGSTQPNGDWLIEFSLPVRRQIRATADGVNWDSLGFHFSPYTVPASSPYTHFRVVGVEGELLNPASETALDQDYDVAADFDGTLYIIRAVSTNASPLRARWFNGETLLSEQTGFQTLEVVKPAGATVLRMDLSGEIFEQISVVLDGAEESFSGWTTFADSGLSSMAMITNPSACEFTADVGAEEGAAAGAYHDYDISGDPTNTHYVLEFDAVTGNLEGSILQTALSVFDATNGVVRTEKFDTYEHANSQTMLSAGLRKRDAAHEILRFQIDLVRDDAAEVTAMEQVWVDNLRLLKMRP